MLLEIVRLFRQSISLKPADEFFRDGWKETIEGKTMPIDELWNGADNFQSSNPQNSGSIL